MTLSRRRTLLSYNIHVNYVYERVIETFWNIAIDNNIILCEILSLLGYIISNSTRDQRGEGQIMEFTTENANWRDCIYFCEIRGEHEGSYAWIKINVITEEII